MLPFVIDLFSRVCRWGKWVALNYQGHDVSGEQMYYRLVNVWKSYEHNFMYESNDVVVDIQWSVVRRSEDDVGKIVGCEQHQIVYFDKLCALTSQIVTHGSIYRSHFRTWHPNLTPSVLGHILTTSFGCDYTMLLTLGRVHGGQNINAQSLYYFNSHTLLVDSYFN